jgi:Nuclease-related domain
MRRMQPRIHRRGRRARERPDEEAALRSEALLRRLPEREWSVLSDVNMRHAVDHVLVGPGGVFAIASHTPAGAAARVRDGVLWLRRDRDARADRPEVAVNRHVLDAARELHREIRTRIGRGPTVHPVVVLWCEFPQRIAESSRIAFVHGRDLPAWVARRPAELDAGGRAEIVTALRAMGSMEWGTRAPLHLPRPRLPVSDRPRPSRARRRAA